MQLQALCFKQDIKLIQEIQGDAIHIYPEGGRVYFDQVVLTTKYRASTIIVRARDFPTTEKYYQKVRELLESNLDYSVINGIIPQKLSPCKNQVSK